MNGVKEKLKRLFFGGPKVEIYQRPVAGNIRKMQEQLLKENAMLRAELSKRKAMVSKEKERHEQLARESKEIGYVLNQKELQKKKEKERMVMLPLFGLKNLPTFFLKDNVPIGKLKGFGLKQTSEGRTLWYPVLTNDGKNNFVPSGDGAYASDPMKIFRRKIGIVTQMRGGKVDSNYGYVFDDNGDRAMRLFKPSYIDKKGKEMEVIRMDENERQEYERKIEELQMNMNRALNALSEMREKEIDYETDSARKGVETSAAKKERDVYASQMASLGENIYSIARVAAAALAGSQQLKTQQVTTEALNTELVSALDRSFGLIRKYVPERSIEPTEARVKELMTSITEKKESKKEPTKPSPTRPPALPGR